MQQAVSDDAFAQHLRKLGGVTTEQIEAAKLVQAENARSGKLLSLADVLQQQGLVTTAIRENIEKRAIAAAQGGIKQLGNFQIVKKLGEGGMGVVYLANDLNVQRPVALKVLPKKLATTEFLTRFRREAKLTGKLSHPNIVAAYNIGEDQGHHYYTMEYCEGATLDATLRKEKMLTQERAIEIVIQIARGLKHAHDNGVVHRDIKPSNVIMTKGNVAKILDMGLSKEISSAEQSFNTQTGLAVGTPHYISPEQARGNRDIDGRSDIYSLGATFYHLVTGKTPYEGSTSAVIMLKHLNEQLSNPQDINPDISDGVVQVIQKMMAKEREDRYANCSELLNDLELAKVGKPPVSGVLPAEKSNIARARKERATRRYQVPGRAPAHSARVAPASGDSSKTMLYIGGGIAAAALIGLLVFAATRGDSQPDRQAKADDQRKLNDEREAERKRNEAERNKQIEDKQKKAEADKREEANRKYAEEVRAADKIRKENEERKKAEEAAAQARAAQNKTPELPLAIAPRVAQTVGEGRKIDFLPLIDPKVDSVFGVWTLDKDGLSCTPTNYAALELPYSPPDEYDFRIRFTRQSGTETIRQILVKGDARFSWSMSLESNTVAGFAMLKGKNANQNETTIKHSFNVGQQYESLVQVRNTGVSVYIDGKLINQLPTFKDLSSKAEWHQRDARLLGLGSNQSKVVFHSIEVIEVRGKGTFTRPNNVPAIASTQLQVTPSITPVSSDWLELLPLVDLSKDKVNGNWELKNGSLVSDKAQGARIELPYKAPDEYDFRIEFTKVDGTEAAVQILSQGGRYFCWEMGNNIAGFGELDGKNWPSNPTTVKFADGLKPGVRTVSVIQVRKQGCEALIDGKPVTQYIGDYSRFNLNGVWTMRSTGMLGFGSWETGVAYHSVAVREISGRGTFARPTDLAAIEADKKRSSAPVQSDALPLRSTENWKSAINLLPLIDPKKDAVEGTWVIENGALVSDRANRGRIEIPYHPGEEYDFRMVFERRDSGNETVQAFSRGGMSLAWLVGGWSGSVFGFEMVEGRRANDNPTCVPNALVLKTGEKFESIIQVRKNGLKVISGGKVLVNYRTEFKNFTEGEYKLRDALCLGVGSCSCVSVFHNLEVLEISGKGTFTRPADIAAAPALAQQRARQAELNAPNASLMYEMLLSDVYPLLAKADVKSALAKLETAKADAGLAPMRKALDHDSACAQFIDDVNKAAAAGATLLADKRAFTLKRSDGKEMSTGGGTKNTVASVKDDVINIDQDLAGAKATARWKLSDLSAECRLDLAALALPKGGETELKLAFAGLISLPPGQNSAEKIKRRLDAASGELASHIRTRLERSVHEYGAADALAKFDAACKAKKWKDALSAMQRLGAELADTVVAARSRENVEKNWTALDGSMNPLRTANAPVDENWVAAARLLTASEQVKTVTDKLKELNPAFDGKTKHKIEGGDVVEFEVQTQKITTIAPVRAFEKLQVLDISANSGERSAMTDLSPLKGLPLQKIKMHGVAVTDISPLAGMKLIHFWFPYSQVNDLSPLQGAPLTYLDCGSTPVKDLSPLASSPLVELNCGSDLEASNLSVIKKITTLEKIGGKTITEFCNKYGIALPSSVAAAKPPAPAPGTANIAQAPPPPIVPPPARQAVPAADSLRETERAVKDAYKVGDYGRLSATEKDTLSQKFLQMGAANKEDFKTKYVLLREARELGIQTGNSFTALTAVDEIARAFEVNAATERAAVLGRLETAMRSPDSARFLAELYYNAADAALEAEDYDLALRMASRADGLARTLKDPPLLARIAEQGKQVQFFQREKNAVRSAQKILADNPNDAIANLAVGKFMCFARDDWEKGAPLLAKGSDNSLKALAAKELAPPKDAAGAAAMGDAWWEAGQKPPLNPRYLDRAVTWYHTARYALTGLDQARLDERIATHAKSVGQRRIMELFNLAVAKLTVDEQVKCVGAKLNELNPGVTAKLDPRIESGKVAELTCSTNNMSDISPFRALSHLTRLSCNGDGPAAARHVTDISWLRGLPLKQVMFPHNKVKDISALAGMPLVTVDFYGNDVPDLSPVKGSPVNMLKVSGANSLAPLAGLPLTSLDCRGCKIKDYSPIKDIALKELQCPTLNKKDAEIVRSIKTLERINEMPAADYWRKFDAGEKL